ncbi:hypothetical protein EG329_008239 [Mollisiaceae sp. DMI_Dod_QoI]|nr:hypothetical protein EG329_008239 [Helotiales sp. DMI_Dod_QoI]
MYKVQRSFALLTAAITLLFGFFLAEKHLLSGNLFQQKIMSHNLGTEDHERKWWKEAVVYEIYPASFKDSNDDGIGDVPGIASKLDYLRDLGVDVIHICPHYQSPQIDMGYDVSNYEDIHRPYGTVEEVQALIDATHARGMKIVFDLVINHSSNMHKLFQESRSSKDNPKRDWYFWRPPKIDAEGNPHPPNNWRSHFTVPAWTWDEATQEYYLHIYAPEMPDFNWENEETRRAIYNTSIIFWLERGIDGFRIDTVNKYSKDISFPDAKITEPGEETQPAAKHYNNGPRIHEFLGEMKTIFDTYDAISIGELSNFPRLEDGVMKFISARTGQLNMVFNYNLGRLGEDQKDLLQFNATGFKKELSRWQIFAHNPDGWITNVLENHDAPRSISRFGSDASFEDQIQSGKALALILATLTGTVFLYQGQEIGMSNAPRSWPAEEFKDIRSVNLYKKAKERCKDDSECMATALDYIWSTARDHARLPMQWNSGPNAGFTSDGVAPWMRVNDDWESKNAEMQIGDPNSLLEFWKKVLKLRKEYKDLFVYGRYELVETEAENLFVFMKESSGLKSLTVVNMSGKPTKWKGPTPILGQHWRWLFGNTEGVENGKLSAWEGRVYLNRL